MVRQLGFVLGVSILVAVLGKPNHAHPVTAFHTGYTFMIIASALGAVAAVSIGPVRHTASPATAVGATPQIAVEATG
jgi:hypothetical protein